MTRHKYSRALILLSCYIKLPRLPLGFLDYSSTLMRVTRSIKGRCSSTGQHGVTSQKTTALHSSRRDNLRSSSSSSLSTFRPSSPVRRSDREIQPQRPPPPTCDSPSFRQGRGRACFSVTQRRTNVAYGGDGSQLHIYSTSALDGRCIPAALSLGKSPRASLSCSGSQNRSGRGSFRTLFSA
jgi:hypothetical protein